MPSSARRIKLGIKGLRANVGDHIAYFWETQDEFVQAVGLLELAIDRGEHGVIFGYDAANGRVIEVLESKGYATEELQREGRLSVLGAASTGELLLDRIGATFQEALNRGAPLIRLLGNIGWGEPTWPKEHDILRFESKVTAAAAQFPCIVVCMYDINSLSGSTVLHGAFGTHPLTIYHNLVRENPMCLDVEEYIARLEGRLQSSTD